MKVLMFTPELPFIDENGEFVSKGKEFTIGGIANAAKYIIGGLATRTERLDVLSTNRRYQKKIEVVEHQEGEGSITKIKHQFKRRTPLDERVNILISRYLTNTSKLTNEHNYDVVLVVGGLSESITSYLLNLSPSQFGLKKKIPYVISLRGSEVPNHHPTINYSERFGYLIKQMWNDASAICCNSHHLANEAKEFLPDEEFAVIPNGVDTDLFSPGTKARKPSKELKLVYAGRVAPIKGLEDAIRAISNVKDLDIKFNIHGYNKYRLNEELKNLAKEFGVSSKIKFHGGYSNADLPKILRRNDIFILPSHNEGDSNSLKQAMATGLPVIATRVGTVADFIGSELEVSCGYTVQTEDELGLARAIKTAHENRDRLPEMGAKSREIVELYSWDNICLQYAKMLESVCNN